jgi:hypothetical protein
LIKISTPLSKRVTFSFQEECTIKSELIHVKDLKSLANLVFHWEYSYSEPKRIAISEQVELEPEKRGF